MLWQEVILGAMKYVVESSHYTVHRAPFSPPHWEINLCQFRRDTEPSPLFHCPSPTLGSLRHCRLFIAPKIAVIEVAPGRWVRKPRAPYSTGKEQTMEGRLEQVPVRLCCSISGLQRRAEQWTRLIYSTIHWFQLSHSGCLRLSHDPFAFYFTLLSIIIS